MSLTLLHGPLSAEPVRTVNYRIVGPEHRLLGEPFPRRVRAAHNGMTVLDTLHAMLVLESGALPQLYVPQIDTRGELLEPGEAAWDCPFKGRARFSSIRVGDRVAHDAVWSFPDPVPGAGWLRGTHCPYKGTAEYADAAGSQDVAWSCPDPLPEAVRVAGFWCFDDNRAEVRYDSRPPPAQRPTRPTRPA